MQITFGWMLVAEFLVLCGILMRLTYLRSLGAAIFLPVLFKFFVLDVTRNDTVNSLGRDWRIWSPAAALLTILFFGNRKLTGFPGYSVAGSIVLAAVLLGEVRHDWLTLAFTLAACALAGVGVRAARDEFLFAGGAFAIVALLAFWDREPSAYPWLTIAVPAALFYAAGFI